MAFNCTLFWTNAIRSDVAFCHLHATQEHEVARRTAARLSERAEQRAREEAQRPRRRRDVAATQRPISADEQRKEEEEVR